MIKQGICYIVGAGNTEGISFTPQEDDYVIAADGGYECLQTMGVHADLLLGDFDSLDKIPEHPNIRRYPVRKDDTDTMLAIRLMLQEGWRSFRIYGGTGGRWDHTIANIQALAFLKHHGAQGYLIDRDWILTVIEGELLSLSARREGTLSVFCLGDHAAGVSISGLKYCVEDAVLTCDCPVGVSNSFVGTPAHISTKKGALLVMWQNDGSGALGDVRHLEP